MTTNYQEIKRLYFQAFDLTSEERSQFLDALDPATRAQIAGLLADDSHDDGFLAPIQGNLKEQMPSIPAVDPMVGRAIGSYTLEQQIASGGMGAVYLASRKGDYKQLAAIKLIRSDAPTNQEIVKRFRHERQFLACLKHPGIAALLDGGTTEDGMPYFVMEYVDGRPITTYCDEKKLGVKERLKLFQRVCKAVQYCHQRGVIHRDLKPDNILITREGDPKLVDFGIAKVTNVESSFLTSPTPTSPLYRFMTIEYASPEQVKGEVVTTLSDVYSLGVILYELLTGRRPLDIPRRVQSEIARIVCEEQPRNPSDVVTEPIKINGEDAAHGKTDPQTTATLRQSAPESLRRELRGDLDTIVLMALKKDADRRYESVEEFSNDIQCYFDSQPVIARPDSAAYRVRKFVTRNRLGVAAAGILGVVVVGAFLGINAAREVALNALHEKGVALTDKENALTEKSDALRRETEAHKKADLNADAAQRQKKLAERYLYSAHMNLAQSAGESGHIGIMRELLERYSTGPLDADLRGFEWHYWDQLCHSYRLELKGHTAGVMSVAFSADGKRLASASHDQTVKVWDSASGQATLTLKGHTAGVMGVAFSKDGRRLASASWDRTIKVWDISIGEEQKPLTLKGHTAGVMGVAFNSDGKRLASASWDKTIKVWDVTMGDEQKPLTLKGHTGEVESVAFNSDGKRLASASWDRTIKVWDVTMGEEQEPLTFENTAEVTSVAFSVDGKRLASASWDRTIKVWDSKSGQTTLTLKGHNAGVKSVVFSADGKWLASASVDQTVKVWDTTTSQEKCTLQGHIAGVMSVAFSPDGKRLASASGDQTVMVWDVTTGPKTLALKERTKAVENATLSADEKRSDDPMAKVWDPTTGQQTLTLKGHTAKVMGVAFSADGKRLASAGDDTTVKVWDSTSGQEMLTLEGHTSEVLSVAFSPDGKWLASASVDQTVKVWDATTGKELLTLEGHSGDVWGVAISADGKRLASASADRTVKVWDTTSGQEMLTLEGHTSEVLSVAFSPDGKRLASTSWDRTVKVWDSKSGLWDSTIGQATLTLKGHTDPVESAAFSPDGKRLASASDDGTMKVWDAMSGQMTLTLNGHIGLVDSVVFSPDGKRLASASDDGTVKVWDATTGQATLTLKGHTDPVESVAFSPDGKRLASASDDGTVKVWDARLWTPELRAEREALSLIHWLRDQRKPQAQWFEAIKENQTISEPGRQRALQFAYEWKP